MVEICCILRHEMCCKIKILGRVGTRGGGRQGGGTRGGGAPGGAPRGGAPGGGGALYREGGV